ncbi:MAG: hypothetical protein NC131_12870 [Roseburia sp.]|nr:hypothetical protein [Roseburia sp.]
MDTTVYDKLYEVVELALTDFNAEHDYTVALSHYAPNSPKYPLVVMSENRNQPQTRYYGRREQVSSLGYTFETYAKTVKTHTKLDICREIMQFITDFMQDTIGLNLISNNTFPNEGTQGELCRNVLVFQKAHNDNKEYFF